jgi:hypothetical protein
MGKAGSEDQEKLKVRFIFTAIGIICMYIDCGFAHGFFRAVYFTDNLNVGATPTAPSGDRCHDRHRFRFMPSADYANRKGDGHGSRRPFLPAVGQFVGVRNTPVIPNNLPLGTKVRMSGALWKSHSHRNDNFSPTADIFIHAELKVGFPICRHYLNVRRESLQKQHGNFMCEEWYLPAMRSNQLIEWRMSRFVCLQ